MIRVEVSLRTQLTFLQNTTLSTSNFSYGLRDGNFRVAILGKVMWLASERADCFSETYWWVDITERIFRPLEMLGWTLCIWQRERRGTFIGSLHRIYGKLSYFLSPLYCTCFLHLEPVPPLKSPWNDVSFHFSGSAIFSLYYPKRLSLCSSLVPTFFRSLN